MNHAYKLQLFNNLKNKFKGSGWYGTTYFTEELYLIRIEITNKEDLKAFSDNFYDLLNSLPDIDLQPEPVKFWLCQEGNSDYFLKLINPGPEELEKWSAIGIRENQWVSDFVYKVDFNGNTIKGKEYTKLFDDKP